MLDSGAGEVGVECSGGGGVAVDEFCNLRASVTKECLGFIGE